MVSIKVFAVNGRLVKTLAEGEYVGGEDQLEGNATDMVSGMYFLRMETVNYSENRKLIVAK
jgi:hypothetical protein